jgi:hypothetical protein
VRALRILAIALAAIALSGCIGVSPARDALSGETLAWESIPGAEVVQEAVVDGSSGGIMGKPSYPTVSRQLVPTDGTTAEELLDALIAASAEQGWEHAGSSSAPYRATKPLEAGSGELLISIHTEFHPARVILTMSVQ